MRRPEPALLFHYTCEHCVPRIVAGTTLVPGCMLPRSEERLAQLSPAQRWLSDAVAELLWMTDLAPPVAGVVVGLNRQMLACDRTEYCFEIIPDWTRISWWPAVRRRWPHLCQALENQYGVMPAHWFVSERPVTYARQVTP